MSRILTIFLMMWIVSSTITSQIIDFPDPNFKAVLLTHDPVIDTNGDGEIQVEEALAVDTLIVRNSYILSMEGVEEFTNLTYLDCSHNQLTSLDITDLIQLYGLSCDSNSLTILDVSNLTQLTFLSCRHNNLTILDVENLTELASLSCGRNSLTILDVSNLVQLKELSCNGNLLAELDVSNLTQLTFLSCRHNNLTTLDVSNLTELTSLSCGANSLAILDVSNLTELTLLWCGVNSLTILDVSNLTKLKHLSCYYNSLTILDVSNLVRLTHIWCFNNSITILDVSKMTELYTLRCGFNPITFLDVSSASSFTWLHIESCPLRYLNLKNGASESIWIRITNSSDSIYICADEEAITHVEFSVLNENNISNGIVSSYCSFTPGGQFNTIIGQISYGEDLPNCINSPAIVDNIEINISDANQAGSSFTNDQGQYIIFSSSLDTITIRPILQNPYFTINPISHQIKFDTFDLSATLDFCLTPAGEFNDLEITMIPINEARPGFDASYTIMYENVGTTTQTGNVYLSFDDELLTFKGASMVVSSQSAGGLTWSYTDLSPFETRQIDVTFTVAIPPIVDSGTELPFTATIDPVENDETGRNNIFRLNQIAVNSVDPNDKVCLQGSLIDVTAKNDYLHYTVRFQNVGTAEAVNVVVKDVLPEQLDWTSFVPIASSHPNRVDRSGGNRVEFIFENINLPGMDDEPNSHGFVTFKIRPQDSLVLGSLFNNSAEIYFDFNAPIETNRTSTEIVNLVVSTENPKKLSNIRIYPNPVKDHLSIHTTDHTTILGINIFSPLGKRMLSIKPTSKDLQSIIDISKLPEGLYLIQIHTDSGTATQQFLKME